MMHVSIRSQLNALEDTENIHLKSWCYVNFYNTEEGNRFFFFFFKDYPLKVLLWFLVLRCIFKQLFKYECYFLCYGHISVSKYWDLTPHTHICVPIGSDLIQFNYMQPAFYISGGTSVSSALECPPEEPRSIVSLDTSQMVRTVNNLNKSNCSQILWCQII